MISVPDSAITQVTIPKEKFYQVADANAKIKRLFIDEVEKITLRAVIAPRTMNITGKLYDELDIIEVKIRSGDISQKVLDTIDEVIPRPVLFIISRPNGDTKYVISYKESRSKTPSRSKVVQYFSTPWNTGSLAIKGTSVKAIYLDFIHQIHPSFDKTKPIAEAVQHTKDTAKIKAQIEKLNQQIRNEPSVAKRQELARERHNLEKLL